MLLTCTCPLLSKRVAPICTFSGFQIAFLYSVHCAFYVVHNLPLAFTSYLAHCHITHFNFCQCLFTVIEYFQGLTCCQGWLSSFCWEREKCSQFSCMQCILNLIWTHWPVLSSFGHLALKWAWQCSLSLRNALSGPRSSCLPGRLELTSLTLTPSDYLLSLSAEGCLSRWCREASSFLCSCYRVLPCALEGRA